MSTPAASPKTAELRLAHSPDSDDAFMFYALATGKAQVVDPSTFPKSQVLWIEGKEVEVPVLHFGTPEWDAAQKQGKQPTSKQLAKGA